MRRCRARRRRSSSCSPAATRVPLVEDLLIGRSPASTLCIADPTVSRTHARIVAAANGGRARIEDAGSSHGTYLDGERVVGPALLRDGALIRARRLRS